MGSVAPLYFERAKMTEQVGTFFSVISRLSWKRSFQDLVPFTAGSLGEVVTAEQLKLIFMITIIRDKNKV